MTERARDKALEREKAKQLGLEDSTVSNPSSPELKRDQSGSGLDGENSRSPGGTRQTTAQRRRETKMNAQKPKERTSKEIKVLEELAEEETRIYKLYKDYTINDLKRDKKTAMEGIKKIKKESKNWQGQLNALLEENAQKKRTIERY